MRTKGANKDQIRQRPVGMGLLKMHVLFLVLWLLIPSGVFSFELEELLHVQTVDVENNNNCQGTDPDAALSPEQLLRPLIELDEKTINHDQASRIAEFAIASHSVYPDSAARFPLPAGWTIGPEKKVTFDEMANMLRLRNHAGIPILPGEANGLINVHGMALEAIHGVGFHAIAYRAPSGKLIVAFEGTKTREDWENNLAQLTVVPGQYREGLDFAKKIKQENPGERIYLTGHSLGGGIAHYVAGMLGEQAVTFNPATLFHPAIEDIKDNGNIDQAQIEHFITKAFFYQRSSDPNTCYREVVPAGSARDIVSAIGDLKYGNVFFVPVFMDRTESVLTPYGEIHSMKLIRLRVAAYASRAGFSFSNWGGIDLQSEDGEGASSVNSAAQAQTREQDGVDYLTLFHNDSLQLIKTIPSNLQDVDYEIDFDLEAGDNLWRVFLLDEYDQGAPLPQALTSSNILAASSSQSYFANLEVLDLMLTLSWDTNRTDVDLHLVPVGMQNFAKREVDCFYRSKIPKWGARDNNPELDIDDTNGFGPENIIVKSLKNGLYYVVVHYFSDKRVGPSRFNIVMRLKGARPQSYGPFTLQQTGDKRIVAILKVENGRIVSIDGTR